MRPVVGGGALLLLRMLSTIIVVPAATPTTPRTSPTLAIVCCDLPLEIWSAYEAGQGPEPHAVSSLLYVDWLAEPSTANRMKPATPTAPTAIPAGNRAERLLVVGVVGPPAPGPTATVGAA